MMSAPLFFSSSSSLSHPHQPPHPPPHPSSSSSSFYLLPQSSSSISTSTSSSSSLSPSYHNTNNHLQHSSSLTQPSHLAAAPLGHHHQHHHHHLEALLAQSTGDCMTPPTFVAPVNPQFTIHSPTPLSVVNAAADRHDSILSTAFPADFYDLPTQYPPSMGDLLASQYRAAKRARTHQRTPSASTIASTGPASPYSANTLYPTIAGSDISPNSPLQIADPSNFAASKSYQQSAGFMPDQSYIIGQSLHSTTANNPHLAMQGSAVDGTHDEIPDFVQSSRLSMSSHGNNSPATPHSGNAYVEGVENKNMVNNNMQNGETPTASLDTDEPMSDYLLESDPDYRSPNPNVQLFRTESQAYQDELYNPPTMYAATTKAAANPRPDYLSPHRNLVNERLQTANLARSSSPHSAVSRERSPFRDGSPHAPVGDWRNTGASVGTVANMRRQQKEAAEQAELRQHMPQIRREPTKTISPKDALLDYTGSDQPSLFQENIPTGYRQHTVATANPWQSEFVPQPGSTFGNLSTAPHPQLTAPFRATGVEAFAAPNFGFMSMAPDTSSHLQMQNAPALPPNNYAMPRMQYTDSTPEFPPNLVTMESSISENGPATFSSQESMSTAAPQRPADTRANTGSYTCTYHGCPQRFDSHTALQKHKRDQHRPQQQVRESPQLSHDTTSTGTGSLSPQSSTSPTPSTGGMTSAEIAARNSQAGPHKCSRINPTTGKPCNTIFSRPYDLTRHEETIHNGRKQKVRCPMCREEKTFSRSDALTRHMRVVHPEVESFGKRGRRSD